MKFIALRLKKILVWTKKVVFFLSNLLKIVIFIFFSYLIDKYVVVLVCC